MHCRHDPQKTHVIKQCADRARYTGERRFDPWTPVEPPKDPTTARSTSNVSEETKPICYTRNYGWDEIQQNEDEREQMAYLFSLWDLERKAILRLQHDLNKNLFQSFYDSIKRIGKSISLALWLWVHRPATCSQIIQHPPNESIRSHQSNLEMLPDAPWLKHFVFNQTEETLPPIARAMKTMLDHNVFIFDANEKNENPWPHYQNESNVDR